jgi:hypothetical protein
VGPELEIPGYGCEDHFSENDTVEHCWECLQVRGRRGSAAARAACRGSPQFGPLRPAAPALDAPGCCPPPHPLQELVEGGYSEGMLVDVGMPVIHRGELLPPCRGSRC